MKIRYLIAILIGICALPALSSCGSGRKASEGYTIAELDSFMVISVHTKFLDRLDMGTEEVRVNPGLWKRLPEDAQRTSARMFAWYCAKKGDKKDAAPNVTVINTETGETLARFNEVLGYKKE